MGSIIVDIIVIAILLISILISYFRGISFVIYQVLSWVISVLILFVFCTPITNVVIEKTSFDETIASKIETNLVENFGSDLEQGNEINNEDSSISASIINVINNYITEAKEKEVQNIAEYVSNEISYVVVSAIVMLILFVVVRIISILIKFMIEIILSLPLLGTFNKVGGFVFGAVRGIIIIYIILAIFSLLSPALSNTGIIASIKASNIASILYNDNIILNLLIE